MTKQIDGGTAAHVSEEFPFFSVNSRKGICQPSTHLQIRAFYERLTVFEFLLDITSKYGGYVDGDLVCHVRDEVAADVLAAILEHWHDRQCEKWRAIHDAD